jgi:DNA processing protein
MLEETSSWLGLSLTPGVGTVLFKRLLDRFESPEAVFRASFKDLLQVEGLGERAAGEIRKGPPADRVQRELQLIKEAGAFVLTLKDDGYPKRLKEISDPPPVLYGRGELKKEDELAVSIVGSRKTSPYGRITAEKMSRDLVRQGITIVSGMARGIDSVAHWAALSERGRTIAVLGCGIDVIYPPENRTLFGKIVEQGAVLSEFPMGSLPEGGHFPKRNRIISGLSLGVVVIQASGGSGSLITANCALDQGREVFAVPANVGLDGSRGTNQLIKDGAKLVETSGDVLEEVLPQWNREREFSEKEPAAAPAPVVSDEEGKLLELLGEMPLHIDALIRESGLDAGRISGLLVGLELKGLILQWPGKSFTRKS